MRSLKEAQEALRRFDRVHWKHRPGADTVRHTYAHLQLSLMDIISDGLEAVGKMPNWEERLGQRGPALLVEHALRLANNAGEDMAKLLHEADDVATTDEWFHRTRFRWRRGNWSEWFVGFFSRLKPLAHVVEQADHGKPIDRIYVLVIIVQLMESAVQCAPADWPLARLLEAFGERLEELSQRFEYARG